MHARHTAICLLFAGRAYAADALTEQDYLSDLPVVLSASRLAQPVSEAPSAVTIIDRATIAASGFRVLPDLFRLVPGFTVGHFRASQPSVTYHGFGDDFARRMQVLVDGRSIYSPSFGQVEWTDLPLAIDDIERIEVVRGPNAASFGSNALLGVINIVTRDPATVAGFHLSGNAGEKDIADGALRYGGKSANTGYRVTVGSRGDEGFEGVPGGARVNFINARADYRRGNRDEVQTQFGLSRNRREQGEFGEIADPARDEDSENHFAQMRWNRVLDSGNELSLFFYHIQDRVVDTYVIAPLPAPIVALPVSLTRTAIRDSLEVQLTSSLAQNVRLVSGIEARRDEVRSKGFLADDGESSGILYRVFGNVEWRVSPKWLMHAGALIEDHYFTGTDISPRIAFNYFPAHGHAIRAGISKAYRTPTFLEEEGNQRFTFNGLLLDQTFLAGGNLEPERVVSREIGYVADLPRYGLTFDARAFNDHFEDLIDSQNFDLPAGSELLDDDRATDFLNTDSARATGFEYQIRWRPTGATQLFAGQSFVRIHSGDIGARFSKSAPHSTTSVLAIQRFPGGFTGTAGYYRVSDQQWLNSPIPRHDRLDLRLAKQFQEHSELALTVQGLLGPHTEFREEHVYRRRAFLSLRTQF